MTTKAEAAALAKQRQMERDSENQIAPPNWPTNPQPGSRVPTAADMLANFGGQAASIYAPQFDFLNREAGNVRNQYGNSDQSLARLYANLVQSINGDAKGIKQNYGNAIGQNTAQTQQSLRGIDNIYNSSQAKEAALLQSLGIQAAAPDVFAQGTRDRGNFEGALASNGGAYNNQLNAERASSLTFNKQAATISKEMGTEKRSALQQQLAAALANIDAQRAQLQSQQASKALDLKSAASQQAYQMQKDQAQSDLDYTKLALQYGPNSAAAQKANQLQGPQGALMKEASSLYGSQSGAQNAVKAVTDTLESLGGNTPKSVADFIHAVLARNPHATDVAQLTDLASLLYKELGLRNPTPSGF